MINLLPENDKKNTRREYRLRRIALICWMFFLLTISTAVFLLPSFVLSYYKSQGADTRASAFAQSEVSDVELRKQVAVATRLMTILKPEASLEPSDSIVLLARDKGSDTSLTSISYTQIAPTTATLVVSGTSKNRKALALFVDALKKEKEIDKVDIPPSNFAKDSDIQFTITLSVSKK